MTNARQWLREELADDREAIAAKSATEWLVTIVDVVVAPLLAYRAVVASWVFGIHHGTTERETTDKVGMSMSDAGMISDRWRAVDAREVVIVMAIVPWVFSATGLCCNPLPPIANIYLWLQGGGLALEAVLVVTRARA